MAKYHLQTPAKSNETSQLFIKTCEYEGQFVRFVEL